MIQLPLAGAPFWVRMRLPSGLVVVATLLWTFRTDSITTDHYDNTLWHAKFTIKNPTDEPLQSPRIGVICKGADGKVNGGGSDYPDLVPPSRAGRHRPEPDHHGPTHRTCRICRCRNVMSSVG